MPRSGARFSHGASVIAAGALAMLFWVVGSPAAVAQPAASQAGSGDELRPLHAGSMDIEEGKRLADHFCADCHGADGISKITGVPNLAGQRSPYLFREMRAYLSGARGNDTMNGAITYLSADALSNVAAYYATLDPAQPAAAGDAKGDVDAVQAGKAATAACAGCHGEVGISKMPGIPSLVGQEPKYLVGHGRLQERRAQERHHEGDARADARRQPGQHRVVLRAAKACPGANPCTGRSGRGPGPRDPVRRLPRRRGCQRQSLVAEPGWPGRPVPGRRAARLQGRHARQYNDEGLVGGTR
jgi:cytochrome c553